ncbi:type II toxin-antitoxin system RelE family toxin [Candidatus Spongiihabitans sp.]|uniref:type II toxin-antitoxin system RelE family toxin n=1 Tax=Candidatus Spongiihabitans sp. TaxID=3101308 RepID=UPI003C6FB22D
MDAPILRKRVEKQIEQRLAKQNDPREDIQGRAIGGVPALFRYRVGRYRVLFKVKATRLIICVVDAGLRSEIYSGLKNIKKAEQRGFGFDED